MDTKSKLESAYIPESSGRKKKVFVALSGGVDSLVTAYLLKIQKYELIAGTVVNSWENYSADQSNVLSCLISNEKLDAIKAFCQQMNIPHVTIKAGNEFQEEVVEPWLGSRVTGTLMRPCSVCHILRMNMLYEKMLEMGADTLATGHFAKLYANEQTKTVSVHTSNDEVYDQSALLSRLPNEILGSLMLPLSDLQKKEVIKLAENFGLNAIEKKIKMNECFPNTEDIINYLDSKIPGRYKQVGEILDPEAANKFGDHTGAFRYTYASSVEGAGRGLAKMYFKKYNVTDKVLTVDSEEGFKKEKIMLLNCETPEDTSWPEPMRGVIQLTPDNLVDCWVYPKSLHAAYIEWEGSHRVLEGDVIAVFKKKGKNAKIFFTGRVKYLPNEAPPPEVEDKNAKKVDYSRDF